MYYWPDFCTIIFKPRQRNKLFWSLKFQWEFSVHYLSLFQQFSRQNNTGRQKKYCSRMNLSQHENGQENCTRKVFLLPHVENSHLRERHTLKTFIWNTIIQLFFLFGHLEKWVFKEIEQPWDLKGSKISSTSFSPH